LQARGLAKNPYLIVSVARDVNVKRIKGRPTFHKEKVRLKEIKKIKLVDKAVLGGLTNHLPHILKEKPAILAIGYDQNNYLKNLKSDLKRRGLQVKVFRLKAFKPKIYKGSLLQGRRLS